VICECSVEDPAESRIEIGSNQRKQTIVAVNSPTLKSRDSMSSDGDSGRSTELEVADEVEVELLLTDRRRGWRYEL
jgi:hypothetical protein